MTNDHSALCSLVGAGPGDPGLLTLKAKARLGAADVVIYDYLCNPELLQFAPDAAEKIYVGKKAGAHTLKQEEINALLVEKTSAGKCVVRLKGGDPFVFGRGGEEAEALAKAGLRFEIIPGISSAIAGPAYAGIPVTHRAHNAALTIFTGHEDPEKSETAIDYRALASAPGTKVMLMGVERIDAITAQLESHGMAPSTPVALIRWATTGRQETLTGDLRSIASLAVTAKFKAPAVAVFGGVVRLRDQLNWFESRPLFGKRIAVTRTRKQAGALVNSLRDLGADAFELPTIRIEPPKDKRTFRQLVRDAHSYDWIVFTSPNGVEAFFETFFSIYKDARELGAPRIAAIGPATSEKIAEYRFQTDLQPKKYVAEEIISALDEFTSVDNLKFLLARAEGAREVLADELTRRGAIVDEAIAYRTVPESKDIAGGIARFRSEGADLVTFTSSSTVENFLALKLPIPEGLKTASIGPITSLTMQNAGLTPDIEASQHDIPGLVSAIQSFFRG
jgi:uroporphyrinogen III methyltransferase/synthase